jgi:hypothetical protein
MVRAVLLAGAFLLLLAVALLGAAGRLGWPIAWAVLVVLTTFTIAAVLVMDPALVRERASLAFFDFPAEHWVHLRTANVIESPFATVGLRQRVTKEAGSRQKGLLMAFKLLMMAQRQWRPTNAAHLIPLVRAGIGFIDGAQSEWRGAA